jgi:hypothetical protein
MATEEQVPVLLTAIGNQADNIAHDLGNGLTPAEIADALESPLVRACALDWSLRSGDLEISGERLNFLVIGLAVGLALSKRP